MLLSSAGVYFANYCCLPVASVLGLAKSCLIVGHQWLGNSEEEPGAVEDEPKATAPVALLASMEHLPEDQLNLLRQISTVFAEVRRETPEGEDMTFYYGGVNDGLPSDPSKHTTAAYFASSIPLPELGALPRAEIVEELQSDRAKDVKQRRDMESAHSSVVSRFAVGDGMFSMARSLETKVFMQLLQCQAVLKSRTPLRDFL